MAASVGEHMFVGKLAAVRAEPAEEAEQVTQVVEGEPVAVEERRGAWARVRTAYDYPGWLRAGELCGALDPSWLDVRYPDPVAAARSFAGAPYAWGGMTRAGIDCSGLVHMSYRACGRLVPRDADQQDAVGTTVASPRPGDLVSYGDPVDHVAFWLGEGRILHATRREGVDGVVEEREPPELRARRRRVFRL